MRIAFPYPDIPPVDVPDARLLGVVSPRDQRPAAPAEALIRAALAQPIASPSLRELARSARRVLVLFDDNTRPTPAQLIVPWLLDELQHNATLAPDIAFLTASGTHRPMTPAEKERKLGRDVCARYPILDHLWNQPGELTRLGQTASGIPVEVNRLLLEADLVIGLGHVAPHRMAGFGGGSKIVQPGVCGAATTGQTHWMAAHYTSEELLGQAENPIRAAMDQAAALAGLRAVFNVVLNSHNDVVGCFFGAPVDAHRAACRLSTAVFSGPLPGLADIVLIESFPGLDMWQASKALAAAELAVRPGGVVILVTPCPEGVSSEHPQVLELGYQPPAQIMDWVRRCELTDLMVAAELVIGGRVICERARGIIVSSRLSPETIRQLGMTPAASPQEALDMAFRLTGPEARVLVLRHGGEILPVLPGR